jgi:hypothetical protein
MEEVWKFIEGFEAYEISSHGRVRSHARGAPRIVVGGLDSSGYRIINLALQGARKTYKVHRLVLTAFVGPCPGGMQAAHLNGVRTDNRLENLSWVTPLENASHIAKHRNPRRIGRESRLTAEEIDSLRAEYDSGLTLSELAAKYGVATTYAREIGLRLRNPSPKGTHGTAVDPDRFKPQ